MYQVISLHLLVFQYVSLKKKTHYTYIVLHLKITSRVLFGVYLKNRAHGIFT